MAKSQPIKTRPIGRMLLFGAGSVFLYAALFLNTETVMRLFTKGGIYAALPIATVFLFSYVHGAFAGNIWSVLGIDAKKTQLQEKMEQKKSKARRPEPPRPRAQMQA